jgi:hypothetical protein
MGDIVKFLYISRITMLGGPDIYLLNMRRLMKANYVLMIPLETFNTANLTGNYQLMNPGGLAHPCYMIKFYNVSGNPIYVSMDGATDHEYLPPDSWFPIYAQANSQKQDCALWKTGTQFWVKGTAGAGILTLSGYYQPQI